jgi:hypothetical protein
VPLQENYHAGRLEIKGAAQHFCRVPVFQLLSLKMTGFHKNAVGIKCVPSVSAQRLLKLYSCQKKYLSN